MPNRVQIAELNTIEGQRLADARKMLKKKAPHEAPKRKDNEKPLKHYQDSQNIPPIKKITFTKKLAHSMAFSMIGAMLGLVMGVSWIALLAMTIAAGFGFYECVTYKQKIIKNERIALIKKPVTWRRQHRSAYQLGYESKSWIPYLKSYFNKTSYQDYGAYQIGLEHAKAHHKKPRI